MVLLNTNIFIIDRFFPRDEHDQDNKAFIQQLSQIEAGFYLFSLFELCGIASFNLSSNELMHWTQRSNVPTFPLAWAKPLLVLDQTLTGIGPNPHWFWVKPLLVFD